MKNKGKVVTGKVRFSYCNIFEPRAIAEGADAKYSISLIIDKKDKETLDAIDAAVKAVIEENKASVFGGKVKGLKLPLRDGDEERDDVAYEGAMFLNASSKNQPMILDEDKQPVLDSREVYSGCYGRASLQFYAFNTQGNKGVAVGLNAVMKLDDGESLGGAYTEANAIEDFEDDIL